MALAGDGRFAARSEPRVEDAELSYFAAATLSLLGHVVLAAAIVLSGVWVGRHHEALSPAYVVGLVSPGAGSKVLAVGPLAKPPVRLRAKAATKAAVKPPTKPSVKAKLPPKPVAPHKAVIKKKPPVKAKPIPKAKPPPKAKPAVKAKSKVSAKASVKVKSPPKPVVVHKAPEKKKPSAKPEPLAKPKPPSKPVAAAESAAPAKPAAKGAPGAGKSGKLSASARAAAAGAAAGGPQGSPGTEGGRARSLAYMRYFNSMMAGIRSHWAWNGGADAGLAATVGFSVLPDGRVASVHLVERSGNPYYDQSVLNAVRATEQLDPPPVAHRRDFAKVEIVFRPE